MPKFHISFKAFPNIICIVEHDIKRFGGTASQNIGLPVCLPVRLFQLASGEVSLTILKSNTGKGLDLDIVIALIHFLCRAWRISGFRW